MWPVTGLWCPVSSAASVLLDQRLILLVTDWPSLLLERYHATIHLTIVESPPLRHRGLAAKLAFNSAEGAPGTATTRAAITMSRWTSAESRAGTSATRGRAGSSRLFPEFARSGKGQSEAVQPDSGSLMALLFES